MRFRLPQVITLLIFIISISSSHAASIINPESSPTGSPSKYLKASEFVRLSPDEFSRLTGKKLNPIEKVSFRLLKQRMKRDLKKNPALMVSEYFNPAKKKMSTALLIILIVVGAILLAFLIFALAYAGTI